MKRMNDTRREEARVVVTNGRRLGQRLARELYDSHELMLDGLRQALVAMLKHGCPKEDTDHLRRLIGVGDKEAGGTDGKI